MSNPRKQLSWPKVAALLTIGAACSCASAPDAVREPPQAKAEAPAAAQTEPSAAAEQAGGPTLQITPERPIEGDPISMYLTLKSEGGCGQWGNPLIEKEARAGETHVTIKPQEPNACPLDVPGRHGSVLSLGMLPKGRYVLHAGPYERAFEVLPPEAPVEPLPDIWHVKVTVLLKLKPGRCFGRPGGGRKHYFHDREQEPLLWRQLQAEIPSASEIDLADIIEDAWNIDVKPLGGRRFRYEYRDGKCCVVTNNSGTATIEADGSVTLSPPKMVEEEAGPC